MKQWILAKYYATGYTFGQFCATGYRVLSGLPHTPVTSLVKYPPPGHMGNNVNFSLADKVWTSFFAICTLRIRFEVDINIAKTNKGIKIS